MSKQYLTTHTIDQAHPTDIFALATTADILFSGSGASSIQIHSSTSPELSPTQTLTGAHKLGVHHLAASTNGKVAVSAGFGGEVKVWGLDPKSDKWVEKGKVKESDKAGELWAVAISADGKLLAASSYDGKIRLWDLSEPGEDGWKQTKEFETKGSFGMCLGMSAEGRFTASGHENGNIYIFNNDSGRLLHSLPGQTQPVRAVAFSPAVTLFAAAGDARVIGLYDVSSGEQVANLAGHNSWVMSLDFSSTGEWLLSGAYDGRTKVWGMETRGCVATHGENDKPIWCVKWLPKIGRSEMFAIAGANKSISLYREASGG